MNCRYYFLKILFFLTTFLTVYSCKKQSTDAKDAQNEIKPLRGYYELLKEDWFVTELHPRLDTTNFRYYDTIPGQQLWVSDLKSGTYGIKHARVVVSKMRGKFSMIFVSYTYDEAAYKTGDFSTYTGKIEVYNDMLQVYKTIHYKKGKPTNPPCRNCMEMRPPEYPPLAPNWCAIYPPLCSYQNSGTGGGSNPADPNMSMPPLNDGGGGGDNTMKEIVLQDYKENMEAGHTFTSAGYNDTPRIITRSDFYGLLSHK